MSTTTFAGGEVFERASSPRLNLGAMTASATAHVLVVVLLVVTWREDAQVVGAARSTLVSIDLSGQEGGPGPRATVARVDKATTLPSALSSLERRDDLPGPHPVPSPAPSPPDQATQGQPASGGEGRAGEGSAATPARSIPPDPPIAGHTSTLLAAAPFLATAVSLEPASERDSNAGAPSGAGKGGGRSASRGSAEASNYKGRVYQHLLRHRQTNTIGAGKVLIAFVIEPDGAAQNIMIARSSGSPRFDREAVHLVRRAAPLPRPPDGTTHNFTFEIAGR